MSRFHLRGGMVLPLGGDRKVLDPGSVLVGDGVIEAVGAPEDVDRRAGDAAVVDASGCAVMPGLHNAHMHSGLLRGTAEGLAVREWCEQYINPAHMVMTAEIAEAASLLCYSEAVLSGTTSVLDMWRYMEGSARAAAGIGIRATLAPYAADGAGVDYLESYRSNAELFDAVEALGSSRVRAWVGLEHFTYSSPDAFRRAATLARERDCGLHTHCAESEDEVHDALARYGRRPVEELDARDILSPRTVLAHCVWLDGADLDLLAATGTSVSHCPTSNMKLASGIAPVRELRRRGVNVGLGTDGEKENNNLDMFEEMKLAALAEKVSTMDAAAGDPWDVLQMATSGGAQALGLAATTGALRPGMAADMVTVDLHRPHLTPLYHGRWTNVAEHLVFSAGGRDVRDVWVAGECVVSGGRLLTADIDAVMASAQEAGAELLARRDSLAGPATHRRSDTDRAMEAKR